MIVGWSLATHLRASLATEALEMAIWRRGVSVEGLVHHSDEVTQYTSIVYSERLVSHAIAPSVGTVGDSFDNAMAESAIGLYKTELIRRRGPWWNPDQVEFATAAWRDRLRTDGGVRGGVLRFKDRFEDRGGSQRLKVSTEPRAGSLPWAPSLLWEAQMSGFNVGTTN